MLESIGLGQIDISGIVISIIALGGMATLGVALYLLGILDGVLGRYQTITLCFEKRQGVPRLISIDNSGPMKKAGGTVYRLKKKKMEINPPALEFVHKVGRKNILFLMFPDRDEAYPFNPEIMNYETLYDELEQEYIKKEHKVPETKAEMLEALKLLNIKEKIRFLPVVDNSSLNLVTTELRQNKDRYQNKFEAFMQQYGAYVGLVILVMITMIGYFMITGAISNISITANCAGVAQTAGEQVSNNLPIELP